MNLQDYIGESSQYDKKQQVEKRKPKSRTKNEEKNYLLLFENNYELSQ